MWLKHCIHLLLYKISYVEISRQPPLPKIKINIFFYNKVFGPEIKRYSKSNFAFIGFTSSISLGFAFIGISQALAHHGFIRIRKPLFHYTISRFFFSFYSLLWLKWGLWTLNWNIWMDLEFVGPPIWEKIVQIWTYILVCFRKDSHEISKMMWMSHFLPSFWLHKYYFFDKFD